MAAAGAPSNAVAGTYRQLIVNSLFSTDLFALGIRKCACNDYTVVRVFDKLFLKFKHLADLYPGHQLYFDAAATLPVPLEGWEDRTVAAAFAQMNLRPFTAIDDILGYRLFLCCSQPNRCNATMPAPPDVPDQVQPAASTQ